MKAFLINPIEQKIYEVDYSGDYKQIQMHIGADLFTVVYIGNKDDIYVDDEGLLKESNYMFKYKGIDTPLCGKGLVLGVDDEGDSTAPTITLQELQKNVTFIGRHNINHSNMGFTIREWTDA